MSAYFPDVVKKGRFEGEWNRWSSCSSYSADMLFKGEHRNIPSQLGVAKVNRCSAAADCSAALQREVFLYLKAASLWFLFNSSALIVQILLFRALSCWAIYWFYFCVFVKLLFCRLFTWAGHVKAPRAALPVAPQRSSSWHWEDHIFLSSEVPR